MPTEEVYPNPTNGQLFINWTPASGTISIETWNALGVRVSVTETTASQGGYVLNLESLASGVYMLRLQLGQETKQVKFVKE